MRNLKRVLSLALALVMVLGMMVITTSAADYTDVEEITYTEAVDVMSGLKVFEGTEAADGTFSFNPTEVLSREEAATVLARIHSKGTVEKLVATKQIFDDVAATRWSAKYIEYCYNCGLIDGMGDGTFAPEGDLTGIAFAKLLLVAMGYDADAQGYVGKDWSVNISIDALNNGLMVDDVLLTAPLTRELAAQMLFQALDANTVEYEKSFDKATGAPVLVGPNKVTTGNWWNPEYVLFADKYFPALKQVDGVITAVDGAVKFDTTEVKGADADWTDAGYAGYVWALESTKEKKITLNAISDVVITGTSLGDSTKGVAESVLTNTAPTNKLFMAAVDEAECGVYYNGKYVGAYGTTDANAVLDLANKVGTKIDYVDNDNEGKAEAIVVTTYTAAQVTKVIRKSVSGVVSDYKYVLDNDSTNTIEAEDLANVDGLEAGDYIAYTEVGSEIYVTVLDAVEGKFDSLTREKLNTETTKIYTIDGEDYIASQQDGVDLDYLFAANTGKDYIYVTDMYGYLVRDAEIPEDPDDYLFVLDNEDSHGIKELAETEVVYADGIVDIVDVAWGSEVADDELAEVIYKYEVKGGAYKLTPKTTVELADVDYTTKSLTMDDLDVTTKTVLVDLRDYLAGDADEGTVYVGYKKIPTFVDGTVYCLVDDGDIVLAFLTDGKDPAAAGSAVSFVVFNTEMNVVSKAAKSYELTEGVLVDGDISYEYVLTAAQRADILTYGVGVYSWDKNGNLASYVSFAEDSVTWTPESSGELYKDNKNITDDYTAVYLNIAEGEVNDWWEIVDDGEYYAYFDKKNDVVYIVADDEIGTAGLLAAKTGTPAEFNGNKYWAAYGDVTAVEVVAKADNNLYLAEVVGVEAEIDGGKGTAAEPYKYTAKVTAEAAAAGTEEWLYVEAVDTRNEVVAIEYGNAWNVGTYTAAHNPGGTLNPAITHWNVKITNTVTNEVTWYEIHVEMVDSAATQVADGIDTVEELLAFAADVNAGNTYAGQTVKLAANIDLAGIEWESIDGFKGTFDGQGYTISNLTVEGTTRVGLFGSVVGTIKNVKIKDATVIGTHHAGAVVAYLYGTVTNCVVDGAYIECIDKSAAAEDGDKAGAIVGYVCGEPASYVTNNTAANVTIVANRDAGMIAGMANGNTTVSNNTVDTVTVEWSNYGTGANIGGAVGRQ